MRQDCRRAWGASRETCVASRARMRSQLSPAVRWALLTWLSFTPVHERGKMAEKRVSVLAAVVAVVTSVSSALIIRALTRDPPPAPDVSIAAFDVGSVPFIVPGQEIKSIVEVHNRGKGIGQGCDLRVGMMVNTTDRRSLLVFSSRQFSIKAGDTREFPFSLSVPGNAVHESTIVRAILACKDLPQTEVRRRLTIVSET